MNTNSRYIVILLIKIRWNIFLNNVFVGPTKYPREKILNPQNSHKGAIVLDPRDPQNFAFSSKNH